MNDLQVFNFNEMELRTVIKDGEPWFVAADVCRVLGLGNPTMAVSKLEEDEVTLNLIEGSHRPTNIVSESGLYALIVRSDKSEAKRFRRWVTSEVLPSIRKTGSYSVDDPAMAMAHGLIAAQKIIEQKDATIAELSPKAAALDLLCASDGSMCITDAAKSLQMKPKELFALLQFRKWIYRRLGTGWIAYQDKIQSGYLEHKITTVERSNGDEKVVEQVRVTRKGLARIAEIQTKRAA